MAGSNTIAAMAISSSANAFPARDANAGTAAAMALSTIPQPLEAGKGMIGMGMSVWQGEHAFAAGVSRASDDGHFIMRAGAGQAGL